MGDREFLETYSNTASINTPETDIFPHGSKSLLTSVMGHTVMFITTFRVNSQYLIKQKSNKNFSR